MKSIIHKLNFIPTLGFMLSLLVSVTSCEQQNYEPNSNAASGGGTKTTYKAYTLASSTGTTVYGRVVFYKYSASVTLVEMGLYNTTAGTSYSSSIYQGKLTTGSTTALKPLDTINGATGAFATNKFFAINESGFYDKLSTYDASVRVMVGPAVIASGNIGTNATPVAQAQ